MLTHAFSSGPLFQSHLTRRFRAHNLSPSHCTPARRACASQIPEPGTQLPRPGSAEQATPCTGGGCGDAAVPWGVGRRVRLHDCLHVRIPRCGALTPDAAGVPRLDRGCDGLARRIRHRQHLTGVEVRLFSCSPH